MKNCHFFCLGLTLCLLLICLTSAHADTYKDKNGITWTYTTWNNNGKTEARITGCDYTDAHFISVPSTVNNLTVSSIGYAGSPIFTSQCSVIMPATLVQIEPNALKNSAMEWLRLSNSTNLTVLPKKAFYNCSNLTTIEMPPALKTIEDSAFANCTALTSMEIPGSAEMIDTAAFYNCKILTKLVFDNTTTSEAKLVIGYHAFAQCVKLGDGRDSYYKMVTFGTNVKVIGPQAFADSPFNYMPALNEGLVEIGDMAFDKLDSGADDFTLPSTLKRIGNKPWGLSYDKDYHRYATGLTIGNSALTLPDGLEEIGDYSLMAWTALETSIKLPSHLKKVGKKAFYYVHLIGDLEIPASVEEIADSAFSYMPFVSKVTFESGSKLSSMGKNVFGNDLGLHYIDMTAATRLPQTCCSRTSEEGPFGALPSHTLVYLPTSFQNISEDNYICGADGERTCNSFVVYDSNSDYSRATLYNEYYRYGSITYGLSYVTANGSLIRVNGSLINEIDIADSINTHMPPNRGCDYEIPYTFTATTATYKRAFSTSSTYGSISLPYSGAELPTGVRAFKFVSTKEMAGSYNNEGLYFLSLDDSRLTGKSDNEKAGKLDANKPYLLKFDSFDGLGTSTDGYYTAFTATNATVDANTDQKDSIYQVNPTETAEGWTFATSPMNVLHDKAVAMNIYNFRASDKSWHPIKGSTEQYPEKPTNSTQGTPYYNGKYYYAHSFRGFMIYSGSGNAAKSFPKILEPNEALPTGIRQIETGTDSNEPYYRLDGTRVSKDQLKKHEIYIHNGKKTLM